MPDCVASRKNIETGQVTVYLMFYFTRKVVFLFFRPFKKLKASPRNLYVAAKECNAHKVLALLGSFYFFGNWFTL